MANAPSSLAVQRFREEFKKVRATRVLGGCAVLSELSKKAFAIAKDENYPLKPHAFILASIFEKLAYEVEDAPITSDEIETIWGILGQPLIRYADLLFGAESPSEAERISNLAIAAYFEALGR
jgi:hypothetical protein